jgi:uncharacterized protein YkwD
VLSEHRIETIDPPADDRRVRQRIALVTLAVLVAAGLVSGRALTLPGSSPATSPKTSACGPVGQPAEDLGLDRTRALTLCLLNQQRAMRGLPALRYDSRLEVSSQGHSDDMARRGYFEHDTPDGVEAYRRMLAAGYPADNAYTAENIAWGSGSQSSPVEIVDSWMHSPPHRATVLHAGLAEVGVGVAMRAPVPNPGDADAATYTTNFGGPPLP